MIGKLLVIAENKEQATENVAHLMSRVESLLVPDSLVFMDAVFLDHARTIPTRGIRKMRSRAKLSEIDTESPLLLKFDAVLDSLGVWHWKDDDAISSVLRDEEDQSLMAYSATFHI